LVGVAVAEAMGLAVAEVAHATTANARAFYGLD
jgi:Tat protein secretion system quality control protein TatD with DNase activity